VHALRAPSAEREALAAALAAAALAAVLLWAGPPGVDLAAHLYQRVFFAEHGLALWNNFWYAGRYSFVTYSVLYYPLAALLGIKVLALASVATAALAFTLVVWRQWGSPGRLSSRTFALMWPATVFSAAFPFALGIALALLAIYALQEHRRARFAVFAALTLAASPLAFAFLAVLLAGALVARRTREQVTVPALVIVGGALIELALMRLFPGSGYYPFHVLDLLGALAFCALGLAVTTRVESARLLAGIFGAYAIACLVAFAVPSDVGSNISRLRYAAVPIAVLALTLRGWRPLRVSVCLVVLALAWNGTAIAKSFLGAQSGDASRPEYWQPAITFLGSHLGPSFRVEVVDTVGHWPAEYFPAAKIPIVRGWYRQDDFPENALLYGEYGPRAYRAWLRKLGVRYVVLSAAKPDYSARAEAELLRSGSSGLEAVLRTPTVAVYELPAARPIVTGRAHARVTRLTTSTLVVDVGAPGSFRVAVRYSPYWLATPGCVSRSPDGMVTLTVGRAGRVDLDFRLSTERALQTLAGVSNRRCSV
jgi:hypothetical protein